MKLYFVHGGYGGWTHLRKLKERGIKFKNYLFSYFYILDYIKKGKRDNEFNKIFTDDFCCILDSGAFSAETQGISINIDEYIKFIKHNENKFRGGFYAGLDVIGDAEKSKENQKIMEDNGLNPLPTYHLGSPKKYFEDMVHKYDYIGLGGMVPYSNKPKKIEAFLDYCFSYVINNNLRTKFHGRGMTNFKFMKKYPFYSVDSSGWVSGAKFNKFMFLYKNKIITVSAEEGRNKYGIDYGHMEYVDKLINNIKIYEYMQDYCTKLHKIHNLDYYNK